MLPSSACQGQCVLRLLWSVALHSFLLTPADEIAREVYGEAGGADPAADGAAATAVKGGMALGLVGYGSGSDSESEEEPPQQQRLSAAAGPSKGTASKAAPAAAANAEVSPAGRDGSHVSKPPPEPPQQQQQQQQHNNQVAPADATAMDADAPAAASKAAVPAGDTAAAPKAADGAAPAIHSADELAATADLGMSFSRGQRWVHRARLGGVKSAELV
jgi:hypothetical protein